MSKKILAVASAGGHWIQLLRLLPAFNDCNITFVSTRPSFADTVKNFKYYSIPDVSRWNKFGLIKNFYILFKIILRTKSDIIITTGAAPGLIAIISGKLLGKKTIWIDSIANAEKISMSGKVALNFADRVYTQWPHLATDKIIFTGNIL